MARPPFNNPIPRTGMPTYSERSPLVSARDSEMPTKQWQKHQNERFNASATGAALRAMQMQINRMRNRGQGGSFSGLSFQDPVELDPSVFVGANTIVYVSPGNLISTTGLIDWISTNNTTSRSGFWVAKKDVPSQVTNPAMMPEGVYYNVPQLPYPGATGTPSGTPLKGDVDGDNVFWFFWNQSPNC